MIPKPAAIVSRVNPEVLKEKILPEIALTLKRQRIQVYLRKKNPSVSNMKMTTFTGAGNVICLLLGKSAVDVAAEEKLFDFHSLLMSASVPLMKGKYWTVSSIQPLAAILWGAGLSFLIKFLVMIKVMKCS
jgi:hypothetical protein